MTTGTLKVRALCCTHALQTENTRASTETLAAHTGSKTFYPKHTREPWKLWSRGGADPCKEGAPDLAKSRLSLAPRRGNENYKKCLSHPGISRRHGLATASACRAGRAGGGLEETRGPCLTPVDKTTFPKGSRGAGCHQRETNPNVVYSANGELHGT